MTNFDMPLLVVIVAVLIPLLTGLVTKYHASSQVKALANIVLTTGAAAVETLIKHDGHVVWNTFLATAVLTFVVNVAAYKHLLEPLGVAERVRQYFPDFGFGSYPDPVATAPEAIPPIED